MDKDHYKLIATAVTVTVYLAIVAFILDFAGVTRYAVKTKSSKEEIVVDITAMDVTQEMIAPQVPLTPIPEQKVEKKLAPKSVKNLFSDTNDSDALEELFKDKAVVKTRTKKKKISVDELFDSSVSKQSSTHSIVERIDSGGTSGSAAQSSEGVSDAYFDLIHETLSAGWNPLPSQKGMVAALILKIKTDGTFEFYIKSSTGDREFLEMLKKHMQELQATGLPKPEKRVTVNINFIAKE